MKPVYLACLAIVLFAGPALAQEDKIELKEAPGKKVVMENCASCHSIDYVQMNSPFQDRAKWEATVNKMVKAFGAPIQETDVKTIVDYLAANYGG